MTKYFSTIFALFILFLSFQPCSDNESHDYQQGLVVEIHDDSHDDHSEDEHIDMCTPFCSCSCCGAFTLKAKEELFVIDFFEQEYAKVINTYQSFLSEADLRAIWQPPKQLI